MQAVEAAGRRARALEARPHEELARERLGRAVRGAQAQRDQAAGPAEDAVAAERRGVLGPVRRAYRHRRHHRAD